MFDLETTGVEVDSARIVQIACRKLDNLFLPMEPAKKMLINPGIPIPADATEVHKITDEMVANAPTFKQVSKSLFTYFEGCDLAGFNIINYDNPLLAEEFARVGIEWPAPGTRVVDVLKIFYAKEPRTLSGAVKHYLGREHEEAHDAEGDINATDEVLLAMIAKYGDLQVMDIEKLHEFCEGEEKRIDIAGKIVLNKDGVAVYGFGKDKGKTVRDNPGFGNWMLKQGFTTNTKEVVRRLLGYGNGKK